MMADAVIIDPASCMDVDKLKEFLREILISRVAVPVPIIMVG
jgi:hypothetical protein